MSKLTENETLVLFTMDVEPVASGNMASGPQSNEEGMRRVREYADVLGDYGYTPTFFIHPELGEEQADAFLDLRERGACLGLHIHSAKFVPVRHETEMGGLSLAEQKEVLESGAELFERFFGFRPEIFRPGCFSCNDYTYRALIESGFKGGSICIPGRVWPERFCIWAGAYPHPHYANLNMRQLPGDAQFVEIPLSVDRSRLISHPLGFDHYLDLRPGGVYANEDEQERDHKQILRNIVRQLAADKPTLKTIVIDVHNDRNFADPEAVSAEHLKTVLDNLEPVLAEYGMIPVDATYDQAIEQFKQKVN